jgi:hypothetical protein
VTLALAMALLLLASLAQAAPVTAYVRTADGKWLRTEAAEVNGRITLSLKPEQLGGGETAVIVNKPAWMVLEDNEAPKLAWVKLNGKELKADARDLGVLSAFPATLSLGIKDNANPLNADGTRVSLPLEAGPAQVNTKELGPPKTSGRLDVTIPKLPAGDYNMQVVVPDSSPQANTLRLTFRFRVTGFAVSEDLQTIKVGTPGGAFTFRAQRTAELQVGDTTPAYLSTGVTGGYLYIDKVEKVETLEPQGPAEARPLQKTIRVHAIPGKTDQDQDGAKLARLQYDLTVRDDLPCLLVTSHTVNLGAKQDIYTWWGWLPGTKWVDSVGDHEWSGQYKDVGKVGWVFLPQKDTQTPGIGWISPLHYGESRFNTMLLYTDPQKIPKDTGASVDMSFALMPAATAAEVAAAAAKIKALGLW